MKYYNAQGKVIGMMTLNGIFKKNVKRSKHYMRNYDAWAIDEETVQQLKKDKCVTIRINETECKIHYVTPFEVFLKNGFVKNHRHGEQRFLNRRFWNITMDNGNILQEREKEPTQNMKLGL